MTELFQLSSHFLLPKLVISEYIFYSKSFGRPDGKKAVYSFGNMELALNVKVVHVHFLYF